jgi:hypothetical protein
MNYLCNLLTFKLIPLIPNLNKSLIISNFYLLKFMPNLLISTINITIKMDLTIPPQSQNNHQFNLITN